MAASASTAVPFAPTVDSLPSGAAASRVWALLRISLGLVFLWSFLDKLLALGFATGRNDDGSVDLLGPAAWINGGSPTSGFLLHGTDGPMVQRCTCFDVGATTHTHEPRAFQAAAGDRHQIRPLRTSG